MTPEPAQAEVTPVAAQADASTTEAPAEAPAESKCEACGNADDDLDIATLAQTRALAETARWAVGAGALACEAETTINPAMSWDNIETILNRR